MVRYKVSVIIAAYNQEDLIIKALDSIPVRDDLEVVIVDDCSTDKTNKCIDEFAQRSSLKVKIYRNEKNMKTAMTLCKAYDHAEGEYVVQLDCDDYFYTEAINRVIDQADMDLVWFDMDIADGSVWSPNTRKDICDHACLFRRSIIGADRWKNVANGGGWFLMQSILKKPHTERYTNELAYHYYFPRKGSVLDLLKDKQS